MAYGLGNRRSILMSYGEIPAIVPIRAEDWKNKREVNVNVSRLQAAPDGWGTDLWIARQVVGQKAASP